ncbi:MAG: UDP-3-O-(3-hydroxymyristoyl)glucosamine N-acyltransferase [Proteobacteria bacterium]|nr:UDP-3-O-(3-hydroxymyristoyl)glucosamine N-acyltransferase [Pseudomonadota bacterium]
MVDRRFFSYAGPVALSEIAAHTGAKAELGGEAADMARSFADVAPLEVAGADDVSFFDNVKYLDAFMQTKAGACFVKPKFVGRAPKGMILLVTEEPYYAYALTAQRFYPQAKATPGISPQAHVAATAKIGKDVRIDAGAVIGEHTVIGDGCHIGANTVIFDHVELGEHCRIGALCSISHSILGKRVVFHRGVHVGQDGFGFAPSKRGVAKVPQLGRVLIADDVELGSGTCVDRGAGPDTLIGQATKIDNLVQIGHNVQIGKYVFIAGQAGLAGSSKVGDFAMLGGQVGLSGHIALGDGVKLIAQSGVMHDVPPGSTYGGSPAMPAREWHRQTVALAKIRKKDGE